MSITSKKFWTITVTSSPKIASGTSVPSNMCERERGGGREKGRREGEKERGRERGKE